MTEETQHILKYHEKMGKPDKESGNLDSDPNC